MRPMSAAEVANLHDPFAQTVLVPGQGNPNRWPGDVEPLVSLISTLPIGASQHSYVLGEGGQITTAVAPRSADRGLRYVVTWSGNTSSPTVFLSAAPTSTHPGTPPPFLQVIGYDAARNRFNYYEYISNPGTATRTWAYAGNSENARLSQTRGKGCMMCHINGGLNMKELVSPWNNWNSPASNISPNNVPAEMVADKLYSQADGADQFQTVFQGLQTVYASKLVQGSIAGNGTVSAVPDLLRRLITTSTVNFMATPQHSPDPVQIPTELFVDRASLTTSQINLKLVTPPLSVAAAAYANFLTGHGFALQQIDSSNRVLYQQTGANYFPLFMPAKAYEDVALMQQLINQKVIDAQFAASILMVDFQNPIFSATRSSLMQYAARIPTAQRLGAGANPAGVPAQFLALVKAAVTGQPTCTGASVQCTAEQQFLRYATSSQWQQLMQGDLNSYLSAVGAHLNSAGAADYMTLWASRQTQFAAAPGVGNLNEFSLLLPCNNLALNVCKRMKADGTVADDPQSSCSANACAATANIFPNH